MTRILGLLLAVSLLSGADQLTSPPSRAAAPDFTRLDASGKTLRLSSLKGKVVLLDFWATYCGGCKTEIPWFLEFENKYKSQGLLLAGVSMDEQMTTVQSFLPKLGIDYPIVLGDDSIAKQYRLSALPMTLLIDRGGRIALSHTGVIDKAAFEKQLLALLAERRH